MEMIDRVPQRSVWIVLYDGVLELRLVESECSIGFADDLALLVQAKRRKG